MLDGADEETILLLLLLGATDGDTPVVVRVRRIDGSSGAMNIMVGEDEGDNDTPVTSVGTIPVPVIKRVDLPPSNRPAFSAALAASLGAFTKDPDCETVAGTSSKQSKQRKGRWGCSHPLWRTPILLTPVLMTP